MNLYIIYIYKYVHTIYYRLLETNISFNLTYLIVFQSLDVCLNFTMIILCSVENLVFDSGCNLWIFVSGILTTTLSPYTSFFTTFPSLKHCINIRMLDTGFKRYFYFKFPDTIINIKSSHVLFYFLRISKKITVTLTAKKKRINRKTIIIVCSKKFVFSKLN